MIRIACAALIAMFATSFGGPKASAQFFFSRMTVIRANTGLEHSSATGSASHLVVRRVVRPTGERMMKMSAAGRSRGLRNSTVALARISGLLHPQR